MCRGRPEPVAELTVECLSVPSPATPIVEHDVPLEAPGADEAHARGGLDLLNGHASDCSDCVCVTQQKGSGEDEALVDQLMGQHRAEQSTSPFYQHVRRAVGDGKVDDSGKKIPLSAKPGDVVLYGKYAGTEVTLDDEDHLIMPEGDILAIIKG